MKRILTIIALSVCLIPLTIAQSSREYIKERIRYYNECKNVAITQTNGDLMLYGSNGWAGKGLPSGLSNALHELNNAHETIVDVQLTEYGEWIVLYGHNGFRWSSIPYGLEQTIRKWNSENERITSVSFNDVGDWIVISQNYIKCSDNDIQSWLGKLGDEYGLLYAVCLTDDALVACFQNGYGYLGNVPQSLRNALKSETRNVYYIKISGDSWFYADKYGSFKYFM